MKHIVIPADATPIDRLTFLPVPNLEKLSFKKWFINSVLCNKALGQGPAVALSAANVARNLAPLEVGDVLTLDESDYKLITDVMKTLTWENPLDAGLALADFLEAIQNAEHQGDKWMRDRKANGAKIHTEENDGREVTPSSASA